MSLTITLVSSVILLSLLSMVLLWREWDRREKRITELEKRVQELQHANRQRLPYKSFEELLDAMAALDIELETRKLQTDYLENVKGHIANAMTVGTKREQKEK